MNVFICGRFLKKSAAFFAILLFFSLFSCKSADSFDLLVPNETNVHRKNIASEYYNIADAYAELKKYDKAITYYKLAMRDSSFKKASYYKLGRMNVLANNFSEAEKIFSNLLKADEKNQTFKISLAYCYGKNGKIKKALDLYAQLISDNPDRSDILINYIYLLIAQNNLDEAEKNLLILKQNFPDLKEIKDLQDRIYKSLGSDMEKTE